MARFVGAGGICEAYERRGDKLLQFHDIANLITDTVPAVSRDAVVRLFLFSVKTDWFGRHGPRQTIEQLIDLDNFQFSPRGKYFLRPSYLRVEDSPEYMRASRSVWARWIKARGWRVPPELKYQSPSETVAGGWAGEFDAADPATWMPWQREQMDIWRRRHTIVIATNTASPNGLSASGSPTTG
jgi:hypothetical protein